MAKIVMEDQPDFLTLPAETILHLKVDDVAVTDRDGKYGPYQILDFTFKILGVQAAGDGGSTDRFDSLIGGTIFGGVPFKLNNHPENRLRLWTEAILGMEVGVGFELDTDFLVGRECRGVTITYEKRTTDAKGNPLLNHKVGSLLPKSGMTPASPGVQTSAPASASQQFGQPSNATSAAASRPVQGSWDDPPF